MRIVEVDRKTKRDFLNVSGFIYEQDPNWIRPLNRDIESVFDPERNNFHSHGSCTRWVLYGENGRPIGRIAAFINEKKARLTDISMGGCGFFECINDQTAANLLFDTAREWLSQRGMSAMEGPVNFGENLMWWGLLIEGFTMPYYGMNYNPPYYRSLFEQYGFAIAYEQISNRIDVNAPFPQRFEKIASWVASKKNNSFRHFEPRHFDKFAHDFMDIYNDGWKDFDQFTPVTSASILENFNQMRPVMDKNLIWYAYVNDDPAALLLVLPDINELIAGLNGRLDLIGKVKFLWNKKTRKHRRLRAVIMGTKEQYRNHGLESTLFIKLKEYVLSLHQYEELELSWVGDFNKKMLSIHGATGAKPSKKHATYRYIIRH
jgi:hypothetical protein